MDKNAMNNIACGLFVLTAADGDKQNGCIINTVMQVTDTPLRISVAVNKGNFTTSIIEKTKRFNVSVIDESAEFSLFERFGFASGRDTDKFEGFSEVEKAENGIYYIKKETNAYISAEVIDAVDVGTHIMFVAEVTQAEILSDIPSATYSYYHKNIKPKVKVEKGGKKKFVCKICGYVYEGDYLPDDFICPLCKHPASGFEEVK